MRSKLREIARGMLREETRLRFDVPVPAEVRDISDVFAQNGHELYIVGGAVRDSLMGKSPKDYDLTTDAPPDRVIEILKDRYRLLDIGKAFGVIVVVAPGGDEYEIATFRKDIGKGRRPDSVEFTTIEQDVMRRDLTINALFYDIDSGEIVDFVGGVDDIKNGVVKAVGDPVERFDEDRLRILRAFRFAARMGSELDPAASAAIRADNSLTGVSPERIRDEFLKGVRSAQSVTEFLAMMTKYAMWDQIIPGLSLTMDVPETRNVPVLLAAMLIGNEPRGLARALVTLKYGTGESKAISYLVQFAGLDVNNAYELMRRRPNEVSDDDLKEFSRVVGEPSDDLVNAFTQFSPTISGDDLKAQGFSGTELGAEMKRQETELFKGML